MSYQKADEPILQLIIPFMIKIEMRILFSLHITFPVLSKQLPPCKFASEKVIYHNLRHIIKVSISIVLGKCFYSLGELVKNFFFFSVHMRNFVSVGMGRDELYRVEDHFRRFICWTVILCLMFLYVCWKTKYIYLLKGKS